MKKINESNTLPEDRRCDECNCKLRSGNSGAYYTTCDRKIRLQRMGLQRQSFLLESDPEVSKL